MDEQKQGKKMGKNRRSAAKQLRDATIISMAADGKPIKEIAGVLNVDRNTVSKILNSVETKEIIKQAESRIYSLVGKALETVEAALDGRSGDMTNGFKSAVAILKSVGVMKDKIDLTHSFPKPTIIKKLNGDQVILGSTQGDEDDVA